MQTAINRNGDYLGSLRTRIWHFMASALDLLINRSVSVSASVSASASASAKSRNQNFGESCNYFLKLKFQKFLRKSKLESLCQSSLLKDRELLVSSWFIGPI